MKRVFTGASGGRRGYSGGFGTGGITPVDFLGVVPDQASMLLLVGDKGDWCIRSDLSTVWIIINVPSSVIGNWQELAYPVDPSKVLADVADPTPGYLDAKADNETLLVDPLRHYLMLMSIAIPVLSLFDNTAALPVGPAPGDRYAALVTANGWFIGNIYQWNGSAWVLIKAANDCTVIITYTGVVGAWLYYQTVWYVLFCGLSNEIDRLPSKAVPTTADLLLIEDAADFKFKKKITISSLPAAAPAAHAFGGALHSQDTIANIQGRLSAGKLITTEAAEISTLAEKSPPSGNDIVIIEDSAAGYAKKKVQLYNCIYRPFLFYADQLLSPNNADWAINALAPASADSLNNSLIVRRFDDTTEEGVGFTLRTPDTATIIRIKIKGRAQTAPGVPSEVLLRLFYREIIDNTAVGAWSGSYGLSPIDIPANTNFQYDADVILFSTLGLTAGRTVQFELTRNPAAPVGPPLTGDWCLLEIAIEFA